MSHGAVSGGDGAAVLAAPSRFVRVAAAVALLLTLALALARAPAAHAFGWSNPQANASAAAGFLERAQNADGGLGAQQGAKSDPEASLWGALALEAAGKNPNDEWIKNGQSLQQYLTDHAGDYTSLRDLGLLSIVQAGAELPANAFGDPAAKLSSALTAPAAAADPEGAALAIIGLLAQGTDAAKQQAVSIAQALIGDTLADGGWGQGQSDSVSTALVLEALAVSGVADAQSAVVQKGVSVLSAAQGNDGSIAISDRTDLSLGSGDVASTAFTVQALKALGLPAITNATGKTVLFGLTQYQQQSSGGLCDDCAYYSQIKPSVIASAQAFPAFDGIVLPPKPIAAQTAGPPAPSRSKTTKRPVKPVSKQVSNGTAKQGISGTKPTTTKDRGAFQGATAQTTTTPKPAESTHRSVAAKPKPKPKPKHAPADVTTGATGVSGTVVGTQTTPKLATVAGQAPGGLTAQDRAGIGLGALLAAALALGAFAESKRPREDPRSAVAIGLQWGADGWHKARARGVLAPAAVALVGVALVSVPLTTRMHHRASAGAVMVADFRPYMTAAKLARYQREVDVLNAGVNQASKRGPGLLYPRLPAGQARARFASSQTLLAPVAAKWPAINHDFQGLVATISANRANYDAVAALPSFRAFPYLFLIPGTLLALLGLAAAILAWRGAAIWRRTRWAALTLGAALVVAPVAFGMFTRAPAGARMLSALAPIESSGHVTRIQNDFGQLSLVDGGLAQLTATLRQRHLSKAQIDAALPGVVAFDGEWVPVLRDFTPLLGVMSDNVANYQALTALPSFDAFPWLFAIPGLVVVALVAAQLARERGRVRATRAAAERRRAREVARAPVPASLTQPQQGETR